MILERLFELDAVVASQNLDLPRLSPDFDDLVGSQEVLCGQPRGPETKIVKGCDETGRIRHIDRDKEIEIPRLAGVAVERDRIAPDDQETYAIVEPVDERGKVLVPLFYDVWLSRRSPPSPPGVAPASNGPSPGGRSRKAFRDRFTTTFSMPLTDKVSQIPSRLEPKRLS